MCHALVKVYGMIIIGTWPSRENKRGDVMIIILYYIISIP